MSDVIDILGADADNLLGHECKGIPKEMINLPGPDYIDRVKADSDRNPNLLRNMQTLFNHGRLRGTGFLSMLPVDQGVEHSGAASFAPNPIDFDPAKIVELASNGGCNAVASTLGGVSSVSHKYAHKIPMLLKLNHNELLAYPNQFEQTIDADGKQAFEMGC